MNAFQVRRSEASVQHANKFSSFRVTLEVIDVHGDRAEPEIFVFQRGYLDGANYCDNFCAVASPIQIEELPINTPDTENGGVFYRASDVTLLFPTRATLDETINLITVEITELADTLNSLESGELADLATAETTWYPAEPEESASASVSVSASDSASDSDSNSSSM